MLSQRLRILPVALLAIGAGYVLRRLYRARHQSAVQPSSIGPTPGAAEGDRATVEADLRLQDLQKGIGPITPEAMAMTSLEHRIQGG